MTRSLEEATELSGLDAQVLTEIHTDGWQVMGVLGGEPQGTADSAYSIGFFHSMGHAEVILFGLPAEAGMRAVNRIGMEARAGSVYQPELVYPGILEGVLEPPHLCCFREVERRHYRHHVSSALWFYEADPFPLLQCFWSDEFGRFPWQQDCSPLARLAQPLLFLG